MRFIFIGMLSLFLFSGCQLTKQPKAIKDVSMYTEFGDKSGTAILSEHPDGVEIKLKLAGLERGYHGIHIHENATCAGRQFIDAGNHFNPDDKEHGLLYPKGAHKGDLRNIEADKEGKVDTKIIAKGMTLLTGKKNSLLDNGGRTLIVTSRADDGMTQISGDSGERVICGEIKKKESDK